MSILTCFTLILAVQYSYAAFSWSNCLPNSHDVELTTLEVGPDPVVLPGDVHLKIDGHTTRNISRSDLKLELKRKTFLGLEIPIPCLLEVGSCTYPDICSIVQRMETENWGGISSGLGTDVHTLLSNAGVDSTVCPLPPTLLRTDNGVLHMPKPPAILSAFTSGDYHMRATVTEVETSKDIFCLDIYLTVELACSGLGCLIG